MPGLVPTDVFGKHSLDDAGQQENDRLARSMARVGQHDGILGDIEGALRHDGGKAVFEVSDLADRFTHHAGRQQKDRPPQFEREVEAIAGEIDQEQGTDLAKQWRAQRRRVTPAIHEPDGRRRQPTATMPEAASGERKRHLNPYAPTHDLLGNRLPPVYFPLPGEPGSLDDALDARAKWRQDRRKAAEKEAAAKASAAQTNSLQRPLPDSDPNSPGMTGPNTRWNPPPELDRDIPEWFKKWLEQQGLELPIPPESPTPAEMPGLVMDGPRSLPSGIKIDGPLVHWPENAAARSMAASATADTNGTNIWGEPSKGDAGRKPTPAPAPTGTHRPGDGERGHPGVGMDTSQRPGGDPGEGKDQAPQEPKWNEKPTFNVHGGVHEFKTNGPIRVDAVTSTMGPDGIDYKVDWQPLDENGNVMPEFRKPNHELAKGGGHTFPGAPKKNPFKPLFDHPYGFKVRIIVPPQPPRHGNSAGVRLDVFGSDGAEIGPWEKSRGR